MCPGHVKRREAEMSEVNWKLNRVVLGGMRCKEGYSRVIWTRGEPGGRSGEASMRKSTPCPSEQSCVQEGTGISDLAEAGPYYLVPMVTPLLAKPRESTWYSNT